MASRTGAEATGLWEGASGPPATRRRRLCFQARVSLPAGLEMLPDSFAAFISSEP